MPERRTCVSCGALLNDGRSRVCAACLLAIAAQPDSSDYPTITAIDGANPGEVVGARLRNGQIFGTYRIERLLGRGGMGEVYEAEQLEHGRRLALKVVSGRLADPADRSRFLREGQLAASVNHPNSVYIFGAEEIEGSPVISMELLAGGTLKDRVDNGGPLPPAEAVDAILQVISGLDAAHQAGVLHRDVKPSNCFVDAKGTVKIGDFGLSISTLARRPGGFTESGVIRGTPQFAAPEQLKGEPLDVRADIYGVGATFYYMLTARAPFEADTLTSLIARVLSEAVPSARACQPSVPAGLDRLLRRCLAKDPADRPLDYATLYRELRTFSTATRAPAPLNLRFMAGALDHLVLFPLTGAVALGAYRMSLEAQAAGFLASVAYFSILEARWGASLGKRLCGLRVARTAAAGPVDSGRAITRAVVYTAASHASAVALLLLDRAEPAGRSAGDQLAGGLLSYLLLAVLFSAARRSNGFASLYDLLTGTRVVARGARIASHLVDIDVPALAKPVSDMRVVGPYHVLEELTASTGRVFVASDDALQRRIWIHSDAATPALSVTRRDLARPGRLRWLTGARTSSEAWNAYEAPDGAPLRDVATTPQPWGTVKRWLHDLAREIEGGAADGTLSSLSVDRVWMTRRGVPIVLEWDVVQPTTAECAPDLEGAQQFLRQVAAASLNGRPGGENLPIASPLPLRARSTLRRLDDCAFESFAAMRAALGDLTDRVDVVSRRRRAASMIFPGLVLLEIVIVTLITGWFAALTGSAELPRWLDERAALQRGGAADDPRRAEALDVYLAAIYGSDLRGAAFWNSPRGRARRTVRPSIQRMLDTHQVVTSRELGWATEVLQPELERRAQTGRLALNVTDLTWMFIVQAVVAAVLAGITAFVTKGGVGLRWWSIGVTTNSGNPVSRPRAFFRSIVACSPLLASGALILGLGLPPRQAFATVAGATLMTAAGVLYAVLKPERGVQDWIAGTWLVPR